jgi:hypothetical protein
MGEPRASGALRPHLRPQGESLVTAYGNEPRTDLHRDGRAPRERGLFLPPVSAAVLGTGTARGATGRQSEYGNEPPSDLSSPTSLRAPLTTPAIRLAPLPPRASVARRLRLPSVLLGRGDEMHRSPPVCGVPPRPGSDQRPRTERRKHPLTPRVRDPNFCSARMPGIRQEGGGCRWRTRDEGGASQGDG